MKLTVTEQPNEEQKTWINNQMKGYKISEKKTISDRNEQLVYKYSNKGREQLRESIFVDGDPFFLKYSEKKGFLYTQAIIEEDNRKLRPPHIEECPYIPCEFTTQSLNGYYLPLAKRETIDTLYQKIRYYVKLFNDVEDNVSNLLSFDIIGSWFQDRLSTTHYLFVVGGNGTGKSAFGDTFECLGYRVVNITNATEAFWYRVLGCVEYGQVTIVAEEIDKLDESSQIMNMLKTGYQPNAKVPRMNNDNDKMDFYYPYCFKILIAERSAREDKARGVLDRGFKINSYKGFPQFKIKEIRNPQGNMKRQKLLNELNELRKTILIFKLIHHNDPLIEIDVGLDGRDEELCKPLLQLFYSLGASKETLHELEQTLEYFLNIKNQAKKISKEAILYPIVANAIAKHGLKMKVDLLWQEITDSIEGRLEEENQRLFHSDDYGDFYRPKTIGIITDKFGADLDHKEKGNIIVFNKKIFERMGKQYDDNRGIRTTLVPDSSDSNDSSPRISPPDLSRRFSVLHEKNDSQNVHITNNIDHTRIYQDGLDESDESGKNEIEYPTDCYYCEEKFCGIDGYRSHVIKKHPGKPCYPGKADFELYSLMAKGMPWEK